MNISYRKKNETISLCMIIKDEEKNIQRCLKSVQGIVDEIIIVDTGSTDKTKDICRGPHTGEFEPLPYGQEIKLFEKKWNEDFSEARNFSISQAKSDWILVLDADEELDEKTKDIILQAINYKDISAFFLYITENINGIIIQNVQARLFPNNPDIKYKNPICENINDSITELFNNHNKKFTVLPVYINHFQAEVPEKLNLNSQRNVQMLQKELEKISLTRKERIYFLLKLIHFFNYFLETPPAKVVELISHTYDLLQQEEIKEMPYESFLLFLNLHIIDYLMRLKNYNQIFEICKNALKQYPDSLNLNYINFFVQMETNKKEEAYNNLLKCKSLIDKNTYFKYETIVLENLSNGINNFIKYFSEQGFSKEEPTTTMFLSPLEKKPLLVAEVNTFSNNDIIENHPLPDKKKTITIDSSKRLGLCVILRNYSSIYRENLDKNHTFFDEIILVNTFSEVNNLHKENVKYSNCKIIDYKWKNDFSDIKNFALSNTNAANILFLEEDELIDSVDLEQILSYLKNHKIVSISVNIIETESDNIINIKPETRIFRNVSNISFKGLVNESPDESIKKYAEDNNLIMLEDSDIVVRKFPSKNFLLLSELLELNEKASNNTQSIKENLLFLFNKSKLEKDLGQSKNSINSLIKAYDLTRKIPSEEKRDIPFLKDLLLEIMKFLYEFKKYDGVLGLAEEMIHNYPQDYKAYLYAAKINFETAKNEQSKNLLLECLQVISRSYIYRLGEPLSLINDKIEIKNILKEIEDYENIEKTKPISFFTVTKNSEQYLEKSLNSIKNIADEIVIIDLGSNDKTLEIAKNFSAKVIKYEWNNNYSDIKNFAINNCIHPWILNIEPYEEITENESKNIKSLTEKSDIIAYQFKINQFSENENDEKYSLYSYRLFKNIPGVKYSLAFYEDIEDSLIKVMSEKTYRTEQSRIQINALMNPDSEIKVMIEKAIEKPELNHYEKVLLKSKLSILFQKENNAGKSIEIFEALDYAGDSYIGNPIISELLNSISKIYLGKNNPEKALELINEALLNTPKAPELLYNKAQCLYLIKDFKESIQIFHQCLELGRVKDFYPFIPFMEGILSYLSLYCIGNCYLETGKRDLARIFFEQALEENNNFIPAKEALLEIKKAMNNT